MRLQRLVVDFARPSQSFQTSETFSVLFRLLETFSDFLRLRLCSGSGSASYEVRKCPKNLLKSVRVSRSLMKSERLPRSVVYPLELILHDSLVYSCGQRSVQEQYSGVADIKSKQDWPRQLRIIVEANEAAPQGPGL